MISKNKIKLLKCLNKKKYRLKQKKAIIEGRRLIDEAINSKADIETIWFTSDALGLDLNQHLINKIKDSKILFDELSNDDLDSLTNTENSQGIIAEINISYFLDAELKNINQENILVLDGISDPGNLGTILRTCAWYNIKSIILTSDCVDSFNLKCLRSGMGAHFYFNNIINAERTEVIEFLNSNNYNVFCADLKGKDIRNAKFDENWAIILGSEAHGLNEDFNIYKKITIEKLGEIESLNASVACGIILDNFIHHQNQ